MQLAAVQYTFPDSVYQLISADSCPGAGGTVALRQSMKSFREGG
jgi:hypothetical protein